MSSGKLFLLRFLISICYFTFVASNGHKNPSNLNQNPHYQKSNLQLQNKMKKMSYTIASRSRYLKEQNNVYLAGAIGIPSVTLAALTAIILNKMNSIQLDQDQDEKDEKKLLTGKEIAGVSIASVLATIVAAGLGVRIHANNRMLSRFDRFKPFMDMQNRLKLPENTAKFDPDALRFLSYNVAGFKDFSGSVAFAPIRKALKSAKADVLVLQEVKASKLKQVKTEFPDHHVLSCKYSGGKGLALVMLVSSSTFSVGSNVGVHNSFSPCSLVATLSNRKTNQKIHVGAVHLPKHGKSYYRDKLLAKILKDVDYRSGSGDQRIVLGDFNYKNVKDIGLETSGKQYVNAVVPGPNEFTHWRGYQSDYALIGPNLAKRKYESGLLREVNSDHAMIYLDIK